MGKVLSQGQQAGGAGTGSDERRSMWTEGQEEARAAEISL